MLELNFGTDLLTDHEGIDGQHEAMFAWGRKILSAPAGTSQQELSRIIHFLGTYVRYHFAAEEYFMTQFDYERTGAHRGQHDTLSTQVEEIQNAAAEGQAHKLLLARVHALFQDWYVYHITEWDKSFAAFLRTKQIPEDQRELPTIQRLVRANKLRAQEDEIDLATVEVVAQERWHTAYKRR